MIVEDQPKRMSRNRRKVAPDAEALARLLAFLGASGLSENMHRVARSVEVHGWRREQRIILLLKRACDDIEDMRAMLLRALGIRSADSAPIGLTKIFAKASGFADATQRQ